MSAQSWGRFALVVVSAAVLQVAVLDGVVVHGAHPDVMLLLAIGAGLAAGAQDGAVAAFAVGLVADLFVDTPYGASAFTFVLVAFTVGMAVRGPSDATSTGMRFATAVLASAAGTVLFAGVGYLLGEPLALRGNLPAVVGVVTAANALLAIPVFAAVRWAMRAGGETRAEAPLAGARVR